MGLNTQKGDTPMTYINVNYEPSYHRADWWFTNGRAVNVADWGCDCQQLEREHIEYEIVYERGEGPVIEDVYCTQCDNLYMTDDAKRFFIDTFDWINYFGFEHS
jgi:hypothetical protein